MSASPRRVAESLSLDLQPVASIHPSSRSLRLHMAGQRLKQWTGASRDLLVTLGVDRLWQEREQEIRGLRCCACCTHDSAVILMQHLQPGADVVGVTHGRNDTERSASERACHFGYQLLARV